MIADKKPIDNVREWCATARRWGGDVRKMAKTEAWHGTIPSERRMTKRALQIPEAVSANLVEFC